MKMGVASGTVTSACRVAHSPSEHSKAKPRRSDRRILAVVALLAATAGAEEPYVARPLTRPGEFTSGIEGPNCDREGNIYAVNFARQHSASAARRQDGLRDRGRAHAARDLPRRDVGAGLAAPTGGLNRNQDSHPRDGRRVRNGHLTGRWTRRRRKRPNRSGSPSPSRSRATWCWSSRSGNLLITSGHVSDLKGKLGAGLTVEQGEGGRATAPSRSSIRSGTPTGRSTACGS